MSSWINGRAGDTILIKDRGLNYGDGAFETMRIRRRAVRFLDYHLERLADTCRRLEITAPNRARLHHEITEIAALRAEGVLKLIITRGIGKRGYRLSGRERCTRVISLHPLSRAVARPARVRLCAMRLGINETLAGLKTLNRLESVLARAEWTDSRIWEGLMRDTDDNIVCGTMSNLFMRRGSRLITPKVDRCGIAGVMRRWVLEQASGLELTVTEGRPRWADLAEADEIFMTNAVVGIVPIAVIQHGRARIRLAQWNTANELCTLLEKQ
ncbi:MAG: 4-amino-4-deoxychorismate lyase [Gammaproteobacteria bacterium]|jgi:4-amino-4-deoxychorismate lyase|nr:4-amino-4-deoxychorismate lyase [Gammaproteobacteria bacterium]